MAVIREATEADLASICALGEEVNALHHQAFPAIFAGPGSPERDRAHWNNSVGRPDSTCFVAVETNVVVGFVTVAVTTEIHSLLQPVRFGRVGSVGVTAGMRGHGIGAALMRQAEQWASGHGATELRLNVWSFNEPALAMYRELGYQLRSHQFAKALRGVPNPSLERTPTGRAPWPRSGQWHHPLRGQGALPLVAAQLKR